MNTLDNILGEIDLFSGLPKEQITEMARIATPKTFLQGKTIFSEGDPGTGFYITVSGKVKISKLSFDGKEQILHIFGSAEPFGEVAVFTGRPYPANAIAIQKAETLFFQKKEFIGLIKKDPSIALNMLGILSMRLKQFTVQVENLSLKEVPGRLAGHLLWLSNKQENKNRVLLEISKGHLASLLGTIPETLSRILAKMSSESLIKVEGKSIEILDYTGIENLAEFGRL